MPPHLCPRCHARPTCLPILLHCATACISPCRPFFLLRAPATSCLPAAQSSVTAAATSSSQPATATTAPHLPAQPPPQLPNSYRRLIAHGCGPSFRDVATIAEVSPLPTPGPREVLVKLHYAGVNGGCETFRARGEHAFRPNRQLPGGFPLGAEGCGVVVALGSGAPGTLSVGQAVAVNDCSAFAEYAVAKAALCTPLAGPPSPEATALVLSGVTAAVALEATARLQPGEFVAVTAAAGGTGHLAVQLALIAGASVVLAVCGSDAKVAALEALDPRVRGINYRRADLDAELARLAPPGGVDVVYEGVGGAVQRAMLRHLSPTGRLLQVGYISEYPHATGYAEQHPSAWEGAAQQEPIQGGREGAACSAPTTAADEGAREGDGDAALPPCSRLFWEGLTVQRGEQRIIGQVWPSDPKAIARCRRRVFSLYNEGRLQVWVDRSRSFQGLESVADAVEHMLRGEHMGKVVVQL